MRGVVLGGGTGAPKSIRALLSLGFETAAVVAMADDGGSTGILRERAGATPPGDIRKCLAAMASDASDPFVRAFQRRFAFADDHALGNLLLYALEGETGSFPEAIAVCERLLGARGHVYPSTLSNISLSAELADGSVIDGQARASHASAALHRVWLQGDDAVAYEPALSALLDADVILLGPGSLYTSIIVNLLVPGIVDAIVKSSAAVVFVCPVADTQGETSGMSARACYEALCACGLRGRIDAMLVHWPAGADLPEQRAQAPLCPEAKSVAFGAGDKRAIEECGTRVIVGNLASDAMPTWHGEDALAAALREAM